MKEGSQDLDSYLQDNDNEEAWLGQVWASFPSCSDLKGSRSLQTTVLTSSDSWGFRTCNTQSPKPSKLWLHTLGVTEQYNSCAALCWGQEGTIHLWKFWMGQRLAACLSPFHWARPARPTSTPLVLTSSPQHWVFSISWCNLTIQSHRWQWAQPGVGFCPPGGKAKLERWIRPSHDPERSHT